jgi:hypothetical protein
VRYFKLRTSIPRWYQVHLGDRDVAVDGVRIVPFATFRQEVRIP